MFDDACGDIDWHVFNYIDAVLKISYGDITDFLHWSNRTTYKKRYEDKV
jgi:hypothetical protein